MADLKTKFMGLDLKNPLIIGSSGLTDSIDSIAKLVSNEASAVVLKSIFEEEIQQEFKEVLKTGLGSQENNLEFLDYYDYQIKHEALTKKATLVRDIKSRFDIPVIASINCHSDGEWAAYALKLQEAGADALELNISRVSCSTIEDTASYFERYMNVVSRVREHVTIPMSVKIPPFFPNIPYVVAAIEVAGANGIVLFNRFYNPDIDLEGKQVVSGQIYSNPSDYSWSLRWLSILKNKVKVDMAASTGVHTAETLIKMIVAGAPAVQVVSSIYKNGPSYILDLLHGLNSWMDKKGLANIQQLRDYCQDLAPSNPELFERFQFMRYFGGHR